MEPFVLEVDTNTTYIKMIRFIGTVMLGFFIGALTFKYRYDRTIDWMNAFTGITFSLIFAFFPKKRALIINDEGIIVEHYRSFWGRREYNWASVKSVDIKGDRIELTKNIGSTEKIKLPFYTKEQIENLKSYLLQVTTSKEITYNQ